MFRQLAVAIASCLLFASCSEPPTAPTPAPEQPTPARLTEYAVVGRIKDGQGRGLAGVEVAFDWALPTSKATTNEAGDYHLVVALANPTTHVSVKLDGYEPVELWQDVTRGSINARMHPIQTIAPGESTLIDITQEDTLCGADLLHLCRVVHLNSPRAGTVRLQLLDIEAIGSELGLVIGADPWDTQLPSGLEAHVPAGKTLVGIHVRRGGERQYHKALLTTTLLP